MVRNKTNAESLAGMRARMRDYKKVQTFQAVLWFSCLTFGEKEVELYKFVDTFKIFKSRKKFVFLDFKRSLKSPSSEP